MNLIVYRAHRREMEKLSSVAGTVASGAERLGNVALRTGEDVGRMAINTFNPRAWRSGLSAMAATPWHEKALMGGGMLLDAAITGSTNTDPNTGRHIGGLERAALVGSHAGSGLAGYHMGLNSGSLLRGLTVGTGAMALTDRAARTVGRAGDRLVNAVAPTSPASPIARGVT